MKIISINDSAGIFEIQKNNEISSWEFIDDVTEHELLHALLSSMQIARENLNLGLQTYKNDAMEEYFKNVIVLGSSGSSGLFCCKRISRKDTLFTEKPLLFSSNKEISIFSQLTRPLYLNLLSETDYWDRDTVSEFLLPCSHLSPILGFSQLSNENQVRILMLACPMEDFDSVIISAVRKLAKQFKNCALLKLEHIPIDTIVKLIFICGANVFGDSNGEWVGLFSMGCRSNHSCSPNAAWDFNGIVLRFVALEDVDEGDEITQSYIDRERWYPTHQRRKVLKLSRGFYCQCPRCSASYDNTRSFHCMNCHNLRGLWPISSYYPTVHEEHSIKRNNTYYVVEDKSCSTLDVDSPVHNYYHYRCYDCGFVCQGEDASRLLAYEVQICYGLHHLHFFKTCILVVQRNVSCALIVLILSLFQYYEIRN